MVTTSLQRIPQGTRVLSLQVNANCNLACAYCPTDLHAGGPELSPEQFVAVLDQATDAGCRYLALGGGEPTLWPHLKWAIEAARARGFFVAMTTNARDPETVRLLPVDRVGVSAPKGRWRELGRLPNAVVNIVHLGGQLDATARLIATALRAGYRSLALLPYKGGDRKFRPTNDELSTLLWLAGKLSRRGVQVSADSYTYRRLGFATDCGQSFARVRSDGTILACCFQECEFFREHAAAFRTARRATPPVRDVLVVENSEIGYVVPLSDSLEVSLSTLTWADVLKALEMFREIAAALDDPAVAVAKTMEPQMSDDGCGPPPALGTIDFSADAETIQRILDHATEAPLAGRRVYSSVLMRESDVAYGRYAVSRDVYINDLADELLYQHSTDRSELMMDGQKTCPDPVLLRRQGIRQQILDRLQTIDYHQPTFGRAVADEIADQLDAILQPLAEAEVTATLADLRAYTWDENDPDFPLWLRLAVRMHFDALEACRRYLDSCATLADRLNRVLALKQLSPDTEWLDLLLDELIALARDRYTTEGLAALDLARERANVDRDLWEPGFASESYTVEKPVPDQLADYRRDLCISELKHALHDHLLGVVGDPRPAVLATRWKKYILQAGTRFAQYDAKLAAVVAWEQLPFVVIGESNLWQNALVDYVLRTYRPADASDGGILACWTTIALRRNARVATQWLDAARASLSDRALLNVFQSARKYHGRDKMSRQIRVYLHEIAQREDTPEAVDAREILDRLAREDKEFRRLLRSDLDSTERNA